MLTVIAGVKDRVAQSGAPGLAAADASGADTSCAACPSNNTSTCASAAPTRATCIAASDSATSASAASAGDSPSAAGAAASGNVTCGVCWVGGQKTHIHCQAKGTCHYAFIALYT